MSFATTRKPKTAPATVGASNRETHSSSSSTSSSSSFPSSFSFHCSATCSHGMLRCVRLYIFFVLFCLCIFFFLTTRARHPTILNIDRRRERTRRWSCERDRGVLCALTLLFFSRSGKLRRFGRSKTRRYDTSFRPVAKTKRN